MATIFVSSVDGNNADSGADWANAKATVAGALAIAADGDVIKVDSAHNFSAVAAITWTMITGRLAIISVDRANSDAWLPGAAESVGAASQAFSIVGVSTSGASLFVYGMTINGGTNNSSLCSIFLLNTTSVTSSLELSNCTLDLKSANASVTFSCGPTTVAASRSLKVKLTNCTVVISGSRAGSGFTLGEAATELVNTTVSATGATKPAQLFAVAAAADVAILRIRDCDLVGYTAGAYFSVANMAISQVYGTNVKTHATPTTTTGSWPGGEGFIQLQNWDSANTIDSFEFRNSYGTLTESASIYATGGASFNSVGESWQIVTTAECNEGFPFVCPWIGVWNTVTTAQTATLETIRDNATALTDREIWLELTSPNSASFPTGLTATDRNANPYTGSAANQTSSSTSWTGAGGFTNPDKRTLDVAFTANVVGRIRGRPVVAKASATLYVSPKLIIT